MSDCSSIICWNLFLVYWIAFVPLSKLVWAHWDFIWMRWYRPLSLCFSSWNTTINPRRHPDENSEGQQEDELMQDIRAGEEHSDRMSYNPGSHRRGQLWPDTSWWLVQKAILPSSWIGVSSDKSASSVPLTIRTLTNRNQPEEAPLCWEILKWAGKSRERDLATAWPEKTLWFYLSEAPLPY